VKAARGLLIAALLATSGCGGQALPGLALEGPTDTGATLAYTLCDSTAGTLNAVSTGDPERLAALFVHGTPGRWRAFERYLADPELTMRLHLVSVDRLGWGASRGAAGDGPVEPAFAVHSEAFRPLLEALDRANGGAGVIVIGHSLGASLAPRLAADHPEQVKGLVLLAGSHDPELRARRWYNLLADFGPVRWLIAEDLRRSNDEIMALPRELEINARLWPELDLPLVLIQGMEDPLVSPGHADYVEALAPAEAARILRLEDTSHFIPWNRYELIKDELLALADRLAEHPARRDASGTIPGTAACTIGGAGP
jgi:pimeloyl-ACP methyl ester carboxylesterase